MSKKWFRFLILLSWVLAAAGITMFFVEKSSLPPELQSYLDAGAGDPLTARDYLTLLLLLAGLAVGVVNSVGLYRFRPWGRTLYLWGYAVCYGLSPFVFTEPVVTPHLASLLFSLNTALSGFMLALLYFSPAARYFERGPAA